MKIRILDDSIRLRLTRSEVERVGSGESVAAQTRFPGGAVFGYALEVGDVDAPTATMNGARVVVTLPAEAASGWARTEQVGIETELSLEPGSDARLRLLIEKDFRCLAPRDDEDQSDAFEHPSEGTLTC